MPHGSIVTKLTWDEPNGNTDDQADGHEDQLSYLSTRHIELDHRQTLTLLTGLSIYFQ